MVEFEKEEVLVPHQLTSAPDQAWRTDHHHDQHDDLRCQRYFVVLLVGVLVVAFLVAVVVVVFVVVGGDGEAVKWMMQWRRVGVGKEEVVWRSL